MAANHVTDAEIDQFRRRLLPVDGLVAFADHLAACGECRDRVARPGDAAAAALQEGLGIGQDDHIPEDQVQRFVDGGLDREQRDAISAHLAECPACAAEVGDLSDFATTLRRSPQPASPWMYGTFAAAAVLVLAVGAGLFLPGRDAAVAPVGGLEGLGTLESADAAAVREALASGRLSLPPVLSDLRGQEGALMGGAAPPAFHLASPVATVVLDTQPVLRWTTLPGSPTYVVTLQDQGSGATMNSPPLTATEWRPEAPLARGRTYAWQVAASPSGGPEVVAPRPPDPPARFIVADAASAARLEHLSASPLVRGVLYANAGLLDDAERAFETIGAKDQGADRVGEFLAQLRRARAPAR